MNHSLDARVEVIFQSVCLNVAAVSFTCRFRFDYLGYLNPVNHPAHAKANASATVETTATTLLMAYAAESSWSSWAKWTWLALQSPIP